MSGRSRDGSARICSWGRRPSLEASASITMAPAPSAARSALSAVIVLTTPATTICRPPPALDVDTYRSTPWSPSSRGGLTMRSPSRNSAAGELLHFLDGVEHTLRHVLERGFHRSGRLAANDETELTHRETR